MTNFFDELHSKKQQQKNQHDIALVQGANANASDIDIAETTQANTATEISQHIKLATQELLKYGLLEAHAKPKLYQTLVTHKPQVDAILAPLDLLSFHDEIRGLFFLKVMQEVADMTTQLDTNGAQDASKNSTTPFGEDDAWSHPLVRKQRLNMEQSLMLAVLRQFYIDHEQAQGVGVGKAVVDVDDIQAHILLYLGESGSDAKDEKKVADLLEKLKTHGIVSDIDKNNQVTIRPIITHVANPNTLVSLLAHYKQMLHDASDNDVQPNEGNT